MQIEILSIGVKAIRKIETPHVKRLQSYPREL